MTSAGSRPAQGSPIRGVDVRRKPPVFCLFRCADHRGVADRRGLVAFPSRHNIIVTAERAVS